MTRTALPALAALCLLAAGPAAAACATDAEIAAYVEAWQAREPAPALGVDASLEDALCTQDKLVAALSESLGKVVGHKAGLTSQAAQARFGAQQPVRGRLLEGMLLENGAEVPIDFGARPLFEADLLLVVGDAAINEAETVEDVLAAVSGIRPFIELPDLAVGRDAPITEATLTATNVAARLGVVGAEIDVAKVTGEGVDLHEALAAMTVRVENATGQELAAVPGTSVLGHPANSVIWLLGRGVTFEPGDLVSVGSIGPLFPPAKALGGVRVTYAGLPGNPVVEMTFEGPIEPLGEAEVREEVEAKQELEAREEKAAEAAAGPATGAAKQAEAAAADAARNAGDAADTAAGAEAADEEATGTTTGTGSTD